MLVPGDAHRNPGPTIPTNTAHHVPWLPCVKDQVGSLEESNREVRPCTLVLGHSVEITKDTWVVMGFYMHLDVGHDEVAGGDQGCGVGKGRRKRMRGLAKSDKGRR